MKFKLFVVGIKENESSVSSLRFKYTIVKDDFSDFVSIKNNATQIESKHNQYFESPIEIPLSTILKCESENGVICHLEVIKVVNNMMYGECDYDIYAKLIDYDIQE